MEKPQTDASPRGAHAHHPAVHLGSLRLPCCVSWRAAASPPGPVRPWSPGETTACCQRDVTRERDPTGTVASSLGIGGLQCGDADRDPALSACCAPGDTATASDNCSSVAATASWAKLGSQPPRGTLPGSPQTTVCSSATRLKPQSKAKRDKQRRNCKWAELRKPPPNSIQLQGSHASSYTLTVCNRTGGPKPVPWPHSNSQGRQRQYCTHLDSPAGRRGKVWAENPAFGIACQSKARCTNQAVGREKRALCTALGSRLSCLSGEVMIGQWWDILYLFYNSAITVILLLWKHNNQTAERRSGITDSNLLLTDIQNIWSKFQLLSKQEVTQRGFSLTHLRLSLLFCPGFNTLMLTPLLKKKKKVLPRLLTALRSVRDHAVLYGKTH